MAVNELIDKSWSWSSEITMSSRCCSGLDGSSFEGLATQIVSAGDRTLMIRDYRFATTDIALF